MGLVGPDLRLHSAELRSGITDHSSQDQSPRCYARLRYDSGPARPAPSTKQRRGGGEEKTRRRGRANGSPRGSCGRGCGWRLGGTVSVGHRPAALPLQRSPPHPDRAHLARALTTDRAHHGERVSDQFLPPTCPSICARAEIANFSFLRALQTREGSPNRRPALTGASQSLAR